MRRNSGIDYIQYWIYQKMDIHWGCNQISSHTDRSMLPKPLVAASFEPLVLALLSRGETYGYEIIQQIQDLSGGRIVWTANRLYPLLHDLENRKLVSSTWRGEGPGPGRKYYRLTARGEQVMAQARRDWLDVHGLLATLWNPEPGLAL